MHAGAELQVDLCNNPNAAAIQTADVFGEAVARAVVDAVTQVDIFCQTMSGADGEAFGCALGEATISGTARAVVRPLS